MSIVIAYDLARLFLAPCHQTPRGIDRIDMALAEYFFRSQDSCHLGILPTPWGIRAFPAPVVRRGLDHLNRLWAETESDDEASFPPPQIAAIFSDHPLKGSSVNNPPKRLSGWAKARRMLSHLHETGFHFGKSAIRHVPHRAAYINVGQIGLAVPMFFHWLNQRRDITCAIMLHDVIPLEYPHLVSKDAVKHHDRMIKTAARHADALILTTKHAQKTVNDALGALKRGNVPALVRALPIHRSFAQIPERWPELANQDYFVTISTIEPRKNHRILIDVWQKMVARMGRRAPHLMIVGAYGRDAELILAPLARDPLLRSRVHIVPGLASPHLARLVMGAKAILCPSIAEGFGLSVLEGNAMGIPTIASDIAAHREIANAGTVLLPVDDLDAWYSAICSIHATAAASPPTIPHAMTEVGYARDIEAFVQACIHRTHQ